MKTAIFADVHANLIALERFIQATRGRVDDYLCLGDIVNYGPWSDECLERIAQLPGIRIVQGNHERLFAGAESLDHELPLVQAFLRHTLPSFTRRDLIANLPVSIDLCGYCCTHTIGNRSVYADSKIQIDRNYLIGHSHHQFRIERSGFEIINPGSIGQNRGCIDMVDYAVLDTATTEFEFYSIEYPFHRFIAELRTRGYPQICLDYYLQRCSHALIAS